MKKLNKMPRSSYDDGKVLAYDAETRWVLTGESYKYDHMLGTWLRCLDYECQFDPIGLDDCSIGSTKKDCYRMPPCGSSPC